MLIKRIGIFIVTIIIMLSLKRLGASLPLAAIITFIGTITLYLLISIKRNKYRVGLLNDKCDPNAFIERTEEQMKITGKNPKSNACLNVDKAAGLMSMGQVQEAMNILTDIDKNMLSTKNGALLTYTINYILCLYDLGEIAEADKLYEAEFIKILQDCVLSDKKKVKRAVGFLMAERAFIHEKYEESRKSFQELYEERFSKRHRLEALYGLARISEKLGETEKAIEQYSQIIKYGNKLSVVEEAKEKLKELE